MTLCHELAHVRRLDFAFAWAPALMERLLFFHPGARLVAREYAFAREAACDAEVLQHLGEAPRDYGRLLLRLGVTRRPARARRGAVVALDANAPKETRDAEPSRTVAAPGARRSGWPARCCCRSRFRSRSWPASRTSRLHRRRRRAPARAAAPPAPPVPASHRRCSCRRHRPHRIGPGAVRGRPPRCDRRRRAGTASAPATAGSAFPRHRAAASASPAPRRHERPDGFYWVGGHDGTIVLFDGNGTSVFSGSHHDAEEARRLRGGDNGPFLYYRHNGQAYMSRDRALIDRVRGEMREQRELGEKQGELGRLQGELGAQQGALGAKQAAHERRLRRRPGRRWPRRATMRVYGRSSARSRRSKASAARRPRNSRRPARRSARRSSRCARLSATTAADAQQQASALRAEAETKAAQQRDVAAEQRALGERQAELGRRQAELGRQQRAAADAAHQRIMRLLQDAATAGQAQPVK